MLKFITALLFAQVLLAAPLPQTGESFNGHNFAYHQDVPKPNGNGGQGTGYGAPQQWERDQEYYHQRDAHNAEVQRKHDSNEAAANNAGGPTGYLYTPN